MKKSIILQLMITAGILSFTTATAQYTQSAKVVSANRESRAEFGTSVAMLEDFAIVGASRETIASGSAYVYTKDSQGTWSYSQRLSANDPNEGAEYGGAVKISDDYLVVAAGRADIGSTIRAGALYVYDYQNNNWEFTTKLVASDFSGDAKLGMNPTSLDVEGNVIIGGAPGDNQWTGSVYVFNKVAGTWTENQKILSPNPQLNDAFGLGVSISGDYLVIGAQGVNESKGAAYIYTKNNDGIWEYAQTLIASDAANNDYFGSSVSLSGDQLVIGAYGKNTEVGAAYIFEEDSEGIWMEVQKLNGNSSVQNTQFGWSTDIQQNYIVVSAPRIYGIEAGEVYFYKRNSAGMWMEEQIIQGSDTEVEDAFGWSVAMYENGLITGATRNDFDENGNNELNDAGSAYIFKNPSILANNDFSLKSQLSLYPVPARDRITISSNTNIAGVIVTNQLGAMVKKQSNINNREYTLDVSNFDAGVYFLRINTNEGATNYKKIIVSK